MNASSWAALVLLCGVLAAVWVIAPVMPVGLSLVTWGLQARRRDTAARSQSKRAIQAASDAMWEQHLAAGYPDRRTEAHQVARSG